MSKLSFVILICILISCNYSKKVNTQIQVKIPNNTELFEILQKDQSDRVPEEIDWHIVLKRDSLRMKRVYELLDSNKVQTSDDYHNAAMIFQHGSDTTAYAMAVKLMRKAIELDSSASKRLLALAIDRYLLSKGKPQIYGT